MTLDLTAAWPPSNALRSAREGRLLTLDPAHPSVGRVSILRAVLTAIVFGLVWTAVFRAMMRLLSEDPSFSLTGTAFIFLYGVLLWSLTGLAVAARQRGWRWWQRALPSAAVVFLIAYQTIFAPTVLLFVLPLWLAGTRHRWPAPARIVLAGLGALAFAGSLVVVLIFAPVFEQFDAGYLPRAIVTTVAAATVYVPVLFAFATALEPGRRAASSAASPAVVQPEPAPALVSSGQPI
jgi:hypothetical protein